MYEINFEPNTWRKRRKYFIKILFESIIMQ